MISSIRPFPGRRLLGVASLVLLTGLPAAARGQAPPTPSDEEPGSNQAINGPAAPVLPEIVARDEQGRVTMRAVRVSRLELDGRLDDEIYRQVPPVSDFLQQEPLEGQLATEKTDVWVFFDDDTVYIAGRMWDSQPQRIVANEMRRDNRGIFLNDNFGVAFDTYYNQRTGFFFQTNPLGGLRDALVSDEGQPNYEWDTVWDVKTSRFEQGWIAEIAIPFKSLRYEGSREQIWGINFRRVVLWKNETSLLTRIPASYGGRGITMFSLAATLVGIQPPSSSRNLEFKPYGISEVLTNRQTDPVISNDLDAAFGFDAKYGVTRSLIFDFTYNTDFAQVEDDEQQVNLTRFSLFFPEKREFFLEGQGIFEFGGGGGGDTPIVFFSRQIGLSRGQTVPIQVGGRLTGRAGPYAVGLLNIQTDDVPAIRAASTNFSVMRLRRDILRRSNVGVIMTRRDPSTGIDGSNEVYGVDANLAFYQDLEVTSYYARSQTPGLDGDDESYRARVNYNADRYGAAFDHVKVGENFNPEIGFLRREHFRRNFASLRFSPRPKGIPGVRKVSWAAAVTHIASGTGRLETRDLEGEFGVDFENGDRSELEYGQTYELLPEPFEIAPGVTLPIGGYHFSGVRGNYALGPQRKISGTVSFSVGGFFSGDRTEVGYNGRVEVTSRLSIEPRVSFNWVDLPEGSFNTRLLSSRTTFTISPRMFVGALVQYNSSNEVLTSNIRFRWEYQPGSDLFFVFSEGRDTLASGFPSLQNRGFVVKFTRLFRF